MLNPLISVVSGTYNRLESLIRMVSSARVAIPASLGYEIIIVDGGSDDGTLQWCKRQPDIHLIEHGELRGAIKAFCDGAKTACGQYVILANDDILFAPESILTALVYLESTPRCGAVAFADNRPYDTEQPISQENHQYSVQTQVAVAPDGHPTRVVYAQVGMFRRWLGEKAGWWGADDPVMGQARTYGGDNYLSSRIWELGYTVDAVEGATCEDYVIRDTLRTTNAAAHDNAFYQRYPNGPQIAAEPTETTPPPEQLRILYLPIFEPGNPVHKSAKRGLREEFQKRALVWEWDYLNERVRTGNLRAFAPHLIFTQFHDGRWTDIMRTLREVAPQALIINWNGDARGLLDDDYLALLRYADLQLVVNAAPLPSYREKGIRAAYWQIGIETPQTPLPKVPKHDIVFLGNCYNEQREELERTLRATGLDVGLYGANWTKSNGNTLYDFAAGEALYKHCKIAISDTFNDGRTPIKAFVSNRLFQALAAGAFVLQAHSDELEKYTGLINGTHYAEWRDMRDLIEGIRYWVSVPSERAKIAKAGHKLVMEYYTFAALVKYLFTHLIPSIEKVVEHEPV